MMGHRIKVIAESTSASRQSKIDNNKMPQSMSFLTFRMNPCVVTPYNAGNCVKMFLLIFVRF